MGFKEVINKEREDLKNVKRPYETASFIVLAILIIQNLFFWFRNIIEFMDKANNWFSTAGITVAMNNSGFVARLISLESDKWLYVILGFLAFLLYWVLIYFFVWNYCRSRGLAKWTWTLFVVYGPTIIFVPALVWYVIYAFRPYFFRFIKRVVVEFNEFDPNQQFEEDVEEPEVQEETFSNQEQEDQKDETEQKE